jgi:hypothetical protein
MDGKADIVSGRKNKLRATAAHVTPASILARQHRNMAEPGSDGSSESTARSPI